MKKLIAPLALGAAALATTPVLAQASMAETRTAAPTAEESEMGGGLSAGLIVVALAGIGMAVLLLTDDDDDDNPVSV